MEKEKRQERSFELHSEKVRGIIGEIPSSLVRYGIIAIGLVLFCLFAVAYFLPHKQIFSGTATIHYVSNEQKVDTIETRVLLKFGEKRLESPINYNASIDFQSSVGVAHGTLLSLSMERDTLGRQEAFCRIPLYPIQKMKHSEVDFLLTIHSENLLSHFLSGLLEK